METLLVALAMVALSAGPDAAWATEPPAACGEPVVVDVRQPRDCTVQKRRVARYRRVWDCEREVRARLTITPDGVVTETPLPDGEAVGPVPTVLLKARRYCPFRPVAGLDARPELFVVYEDPDVGRCYLYWPLDRAALETLGAYDRRAHLAGLHPYVRAATERAMATAAEAGHAFRVISGVRAGGRPSWHSYGLAVDVNLHHRRGLGEATSAYLAGGEERAAWILLGDAGEALGMFWLGREVPGEIFHFEWHPGWPGLPRGALARELDAANEAGGLEAVWQRLRYDATRKSAMRHLRD